MNNTDEVIKVFIVDDERLVRDLLKNCIDWNELGFSVVGESSNAVEGLEMVDKLEPDLIFTDICMPVMDGLEFGRKVMEKHQEAKIVVLTGHDKFEYAREGIKLGIADFLLKPINDDEIKKTALAMKNEILENKKQREEYLRIKEQLINNMPFLREKFFNELISSNFELYEYEEKMKYFGIETRDDIFQTAVIEISGENVISSGEESRIIAGLRLREQVEAFFYDKKNIFAFPNSTQRMVVICNDSRVDFYEMCEELKDKLIESLKFNICIGVGNAYGRPDMISNSYREALGALEYKFITGKNQVILFSDIYYTQEKESVQLNELLGSFVFYVRSGLKEKAEEIVDDVFSEARHNIAAKEQLRVISFNFVAGIMNILIETGLSKEEVFSDNEQPFERIIVMETMPEMRNYLGEIIEKCTSIINSNQHKKVRKIFLDVKEYIDSNFNDPEISLSEVAKKFFVNLSYLSKIFKEENGITFVDYLIKLRMDHAIELLKATDQKAYQIAEEVGIKDPHYFSVCFKKYTGVSVNEYRKAR